MRVRSCRARTGGISSADAAWPEVKLADAASVLATAIAAFVPPAAVENLGSDQPTPDRRTPRQVDVERLLAAAPATSDQVAASVPPVCRSLSPRRGGR